VLKGFLTELPASLHHVKQNQIVDDGCLLFIPSKSVSKQVSATFDTTEFDKKIFLVARVISGRDWRVVQACCRSRILLRHHLQGSLLCR
jgi:hypothetical protein